MNIGSSRVSASMFFNRCLYLPEIISVDFEVALNAMNTFKTKIQAPSFLGDTASVSRCKLVLYSFSLCKINLIIIPMILQNFVYKYNIVIIKTPRFIRSSVINLTFRKCKITGYSYILCTINWIIICSDYYSIY